MVIPNKEPSYAHFFHVFSHTEIKNILVTGDAEIGYIGFGEKGKIKDMRPNLTFNCQYPRSATCAWGWFQLNICLPGGSGSWQPRKLDLKFDLKTRFLTTTGLQLPLSSQHVNPMALLTRQTGLHSPVSCVSLDFYPYQIFGFETNLIPSYYDWVFWLHNNK